MSTSGSSSPSSSQVKKPSQVTLTSTTPSSPSRSHGANTSPSQTGQVGGALLNSILQQKNARATNAAKSDSTATSPIPGRANQNRSDSAGSSSPRASPASSSATRSNNSRDFGPWVVDTSQVKLGKELGRGAFGIVYRGSYMGTTVAVKVLPYKHNDLDEVKEKFKNEVKVLRSIRHPHIVLFIGFGAQKGELLLVQEFVTGGSLKSLLEDPVRFGSLSWVDRVRISSQIAGALSYLHARDILHRDLKSENILLTDTCQVKVADFGLSRVLAPATDSMKRGSCVGTPWWRAPEVDTVENYNYKIDIFSLGVVLAEIATRADGEEIRLSMSFQKKNPNSLNNSLSFGVDPQRFVKEFKEVLSTCPKLFLDLTIACCEEDPHKRPELSDLLARFDSLQSMWELYENEMRARYVSLTNDDAISGKNDAVSLWCASTFHNISAFSSPTPPTRNATSSAPELAKGTLCNTSDLISRFVFSIRKLAPKREISAEEMQFLTDLVGAQTISFEKFSVTLWPLLRGMTSCLSRSVTLLKLFRSKSFLGLITKAQCKSLLTKTTNAVAIRFSQKNSNEIILSVSTTTDAVEEIRFELSPDGEQIFVLEGDNTWKKYLSLFDLFRSHATLKQMTHFAGSDLKISDELSSAVGNGSGTVQKGTTVILKRKDSL